MYLYPNIYFTPNFLVYINSHTFFLNPHSTTKISSPTATMSRATTLLLIVTLLLSSTLFSTSARPEPTTAATTKTINKGVEVEEGCEGVGEEECLMRRTLVAHLDYIYTQKKNP